MKIKRVQIAIAIGAVAMLIGILMPGTGCPSPPCCPHIAKFESAYDYVCAECPDAGTRLFYQLNYVKHETTEACWPSDQYVTRLKNLTENIKVDTSYAFAKKPNGVYENPSGGAYVELKQDSTIELHATGDSECPAAVETIEVKVVKSGTRSELCVAFNAELGFWTGDTKAYGPGVVIRRLENPATQPSHQAVAINVKLDAIQHNSLGPGKPSDLFKGQSPNGKWILEIPEKNDYDQYPKDKPLCVNLELTCSCP